MLVHGHGTAPNIAADEWQTEHREQALDRAVFARRSVQDGEDHVRRHLAECPDEVAVDLDHRHTVTAAFEGARHARSG